MTKLKVQDNYKISLGKYCGLLLDVAKDSKGNIEIILDGELRYNPDDFLRMALDAMRAASLLEVYG